MRTELAHAEVSGPSGALALAARAADDLKAAGKIVGDLTFTPTDADSLSVRAEIAPSPDA
jgi:valyl-tRNA synthetase